MHHPGDLPIAEGALFQGRYRILRELGVGGTAAIYEAQQLVTGQRVAIKVLRLGGEDEAAADKRIARFQREMRLCAQLHHPNLVRLIDSGTADEGLFYSAFEYVPGQDLSKILAAEGALEPRETQHLMLQILDALACVHAAGVVHRDLKPRNIMIVSTGARRNAVILDFGIGAITEEARGPDYSRLTDSDESPGTPAYAAPEQLRGLSPTPRSDLYSWGLVYLECLTGAQVMTGDSLADVLFKQLGPDPIPLPSWLEGHLLAGLLARVLDKDVAARDVTAEQLLRDLSDCDMRGLSRRGERIPST